MNNSALRAIGVIALVVGVIGGGFLGTLGFLQHDTVFAGVGIGAGVLLALVGLPMLAAGDGVVLRFE